MSSQRESIHRCQDQRESIDKCQGQREGMPDKCQGYTKNYA